MTDRFALTDEMVERMLKRRAARASTTDLVTLTRSALAGTPQKGAYRGVLDWWGRRLAVPRPIQAAVLVVGLLVVALIGSSVLGPGGSRVGGSLPSPSITSPPPSPSIPSYASPSPEEGGPPRPLAAGTHTATFWPSLTMTVPDGWLYENAADGFIGLVPNTDENTKRIREGSYPVTFLDVFRNLSIAAADCTETAATDVGNTASDMIGALARRRGLVVTDPVPVTIGGLSGQQIDFATEPSWSATCPGVEGPFVPTVYGKDFLWWGASPGERFRIIVLDVAPLPSDMYATVMIFVYSADATAWNEHLAASMKLIETFEFAVTKP